MKIRSGFVSNSSSSSFIIAAEDEKLVIKVELDISKLVENVLKTKEEVLKYFLDSHMCDDEAEILADRYNSARYTKMIAAIDSGKKIFIGCAGSESDDPVELFLYGGGINLANNIEVIDTLN